MQFGQNESMWGRAIYFAVNASYSNYYAHTSGGNKMMFLAEVLIGDSISLPSQKLIKPPIKKGTAIEYDSV